MYKFSFINKGLGQIQIGDFKEEFESDTNYWSVQEHIVFLNKLEEPFDINNPHKHIKPYESISEDGEEISEWLIKQS